MKYLIVENLLPISVYVKFGEELMEDGRANPKVLLARMHFSQPESDNPEGKIKEITTKQQYTFHLPDELEEIKMNMEEILPSANYEGGEDENTLFIRLVSLRTGKN